MSRPDGPELKGRRVLLRPLVSADFSAWREVRRRNGEWLTQWEPLPTPGAPDAVEDARAFTARCGARDRERQLGTGYGFGIFVDGRFGGEVNLASIVRGAMQSCSIGYWVDQALAGNGYTPEATVAVIRFALEDLALHRVEVGVVPRNAPSRRVMEKLGLREEGVALRMLRINGVWEDHIRYAITAEEWADVGPTLTSTWL